MTLRGIRAIIWDLDGALVDTMPDIVNALRAAARAVGYGELTDEQTSNKVGGGAHNAITAIFGEEHQRLIEPALDHFRTYYPEHCADESRLYPGIIEVLNHFKGNVRCALATAKIRTAVLQLLDSLDVLEYFDYLVTADDMQRMKPDPQCIEMILQHFGIYDPSEATIIGDMKTDIQAGVAAGVHTVGVTYGYGKACDLRAFGPDSLVDSPLELIDTIRWD